MVWIKSPTGCSPAAAIPACTPRGAEQASRLLPGESNTPVFIPPTDLVEDIGDDGNGCILVYTDDCSGNNPLIAALTEKGLAYTHYSQSPYAFESMVAADVFNLILIDHSCYNDFSYSWDDLVTAYQSDVCIGVASYDWDGSDDVSGAVSSFLAAGGGGYSIDIPSQGSLHVWDPAPIFTGLPGTLSPTRNFYLDEGDGWTFATADAGWTPAPTPGQGAALIAPRLGLLGFLPDQLSPADGTTLWKNTIDYLMICGAPTPTLRPTTWSEIKIRFR